MAIEPEKEELWRPEAPGDPSGSYISSPYGGAAFYEEPVYEPQFQRYAG